MHSFAVIISFIKIWFLSFCTITFLNRNNAKECIRGIRNKFEKLEHFYDSFTI